MTLEKYFTSKLKWAQAQYSRCGAATMVNEEGNSVLVDRNTDIPSMEVTDYLGNTDCIKITEE